MFCVRCGSSLPESASFCPSCGAPVAAVAAAPETVAYLPPPTVAGGAAAAAQDYGGFWRRFWSHVLDRFILGLVFVPVGFVFFVPIMAANSIDWADPDLVGEAFGALIGGFVALAFLALLGSWLYYALLHGSSRQATLGQMALGIRVTDVGGRRVTFARASGRYFASLLTNLTFGIGYLILLFTVRKQALHDLIAGTLVLR